MKIKSFIVSILSSAMVLIMSVNVSAITPSFNCRLQRGVGKMYYYVHETTEEYVSQINAAAENWINTGYGYNPIYLYPVASNNGTEMDFYGTSDGMWGGGVVLAETSFFLSSAVEVQPDVQDWYYTEIFINRDLMKVSSLGDGVQGTLAHEMGHAMGLKHYNTNPYSIMCQTGVQRITQRVGQEDHDAINAKY